MQEVDAGLSPSLPHRGLLSGFCIPACFAPFEVCLQKCLCNLVLLETLSSMVLLVLTQSFGSGVLSLFLTSQNLEKKKKKEFTFSSWSAIHPGPIFFGLSIRISKNKHTGQALCGKKIWTQNSAPVISATL